MFERYTEQARDVMAKAQEEARLLKHNYIGTEHLLLGLLASDARIVPYTLERYGIGIDELRDKVAEIVGRGDTVLDGPLPFTPRAKKVLELALREALSLGHNFIGPEHILLGLVKENEGVAARIMLDYGATSERIREDIIWLLMHPQAYAKESTAVSVDEQTLPTSISLADAVKALRDRMFAEAPPIPPARLSFDRLNREELEALVDLLRKASY